METRQFQFQRFTQKIRKSQLSQWCDADFQLKSDRSSDGRVSLQPLPSLTCWITFALKRGAKIRADSLRSGISLFGLREDWVTHYYVEVDGYLTKATSSFGKLFVFVGRPSSLRVAGVHVQALPVLFMRPWPTRVEGNGKGRCLDRCDASSSALCEVRRLEKGLRLRLSVFLSQSLNVGVIKPVR